MNAGTYNVKIDAGKTVRVKFTAPYAGTWNFYSTGSGDTYGTLYNASKKTLTSNDNSGDGKNFYISYDLSKNQTVYLDVKFKNSKASGEVKVHVEAVSPLTLSSSITSDKGRHTISWTDSGRNSPYKVEYQYIVSGVTHRVETAATDLTETRYTFDSLIPGMKVKITVTGKDGVKAQKTYVLDEAESFKNGTFKRSDIRFKVYPQYLNEGEDWANAHNIASGKMSASEVIKYIDTRMYGVRASIDYVSSPKSGTSYHLVLAMIAPNGYTESIATYDFRIGYDEGWLYWYCTGSDMLKNYYKDKNTLPKGTWTVQLYFDGMLAGSSTFKMT